MEKKNVFKRVLKIFFIIVALLIIILAIHTIRNYIIIRNLQDKISQYKEITNYNIKATTKHEDGTIIITDYYTKDDKQVVFMEKTTNNETTKVSMYDNGQRTDMFVENKDSKIANLNSGSLIRLEVVNQLEMDNNWQTFLASLMAGPIRSKKENDKKYYIIENFYSQIVLSGKGKNQIFIDKETGLLVKSVLNDSVSDREYEFEKVKEDIFIEPDISQYTLKEKN